MDASILNLVTGSKTGFVRERIIATYYFVSCDSSTGVSFHESRTPVLILYSRG